MKQRRKIPSDVLRHFEKKSSRRQRPTNEPDERHILIMLCLKLAEFALLPAGIAQDDNGMFYAAIQLPDGVITLPVDANKMQGLFHTYALDEPVMSPDDLWPRVRRVLKGRLRRMLFVDKEDKGADHADGQGDDHGRDGEFGESDPGAGSPGEMAGIIHDPGPE